MSSHEITVLLKQAASGDSAAMDEVFASVYPHLRELAERRRRSWRGDYTLGTTALIHEAYLKVAGAQAAEYEDRAHFFSTAATAMRQVLINYAEKKSAQKRGGGAAAVTLMEGDAVTEDQAVEELLTLEDALRKLEELSPRQGKVVECLFFAGLSIQDTADTLGSSPATVKRDWAAARAWLFREMQGGAEG